jgi:hypothetical protein
MTTPPLPTHEEVLTRVYALHAQAAERQGADLLLEYVDDCFHADQFQCVDLLLDSADPSRLGVTLGLGLLITSRWAKSKLENRSSFSKRYRVYLESTESPNRVFNLTNGLD